jgi:hypothetical protein
MTGSVVLTHHKTKTISNTDPSIPSQSKNNEHHGFSHPITKLKQLAPHIQPSDHKTKTMSTTDPAIPSSVLLIVLVL